MNTPGAAADIGREDLIDGKVDAAGTILDACARPEVRGYFAFWFRVSTSTLAVGPDEAGF